MPTNSWGPTLYAKPMDGSQAYCAAAYGGSGYPHQSYFVNMNGTIGENCNPKCTCDPLFWVDFNVNKPKKTVPFKVHMQKDPSEYKHNQGHNRSRDNDHTNFVGETPNCEEMNRTEMA
ncbi:hypothetical protein GOODEAATRI_034457 [Goodea atripinnis]|uniref:Uncharacterized protein n=1 Tax=Goodea atripinnis TaxID=208336 RepID=A0ABV0NIH3_9TELE